jgi:hypothetical protein
VTVPGYNASTIGCPGCHAPLPPQIYNSGAGESCPSCRAEVLVEVFPALFAGPAEAAADEGAPGEASCFFHDGKKAAAVCSSCGRFLCPLCRVDLSDGIHCPDCVTGGRKKGEIESLVNRRTLSDSIALSVAILPMLVFWVTPISAPLAIYLAIRGWKKPSSVLPPTRIRFVLAIFFAVLQIGGWGFVLARFLL